MNKIIRIGNKEISRIGYGTLYIPVERGFGPARSNAVDLLKEAKNLGIDLTESAAMTPAASVSGLYFAHPDARYFDIGKIGADQMDSYATRKRFTLDEAERWLTANLAYDPTSADS